MLNKQLQLQTTEKLTKSNTTTFVCLNCYAKTKLDKSIEGIINAGHFTCTNCGKGEIKSKKYGKEDNYTPEPCILEGNNEEWTTTP